MMIIQGNKKKYIRKNTFPVDCLSQREISKFKLPLHMFYDFSFFYFRQRKDKYERKEHKEKV